MNNYKKIEENIIASFFLTTYVHEEICSTVKPFMFYDADLKTIAEVIWEMTKEDATIDLVTISAAFNARNLDSVKYSLIICDITDRLANATHIHDYLKLLKQQYVERKETENALTLIQNIKKGKDIFECIDAHEKARAEMMDGVIFRAGSYIGDVNAIETILAAYETQELPGIPTGYGDFDDLFGGWQRTDLVILAAYAGMGKTSLMLCFALAAAKNGRKVGIASLEMSAEQLKMRFYSLLTGISVKKQKNGCLDSGELEMLKEADVFLSDLPILIEDGSYSDAQIMATVMGWKKSEGVELVFIDYLQLMKSSEGGEREDIRIGAITRNLKLLAGKKKANIPIFALSQLSRPQKGAIVKMPKLSDLRGSGCIEQDADAVMFVHRPEYFWQNEDDVIEEEIGKAYIGVAKNRHGETTTVTMRFRASCTRFEEIKEIDFDSGGINTGINQRDIFGEVKQLDSYYERPDPEDVDSIPF